MSTLFGQLWRGKRDVALVLGMIAILVILFTPIPAALLDFLLVLNFTLAMLVLLITFFTDKPLSFSTFPSLLLITTLFRLALNISATRLILDKGNAGRVINAIGSYVVGGNYVIGLVVFLILVIVQYVVVTSGAQRVAEVAARFTLDSMPGKQMSIDADMNMGLIDEKEAKLRRSGIEKEASFYGAMDGATKFVKGDAIAGILIILIDVIGGLTVGMVQHGMAWSEAAQGTKESRDDVTYYVTHPACAWRAWPLGFQPSRRRVIVSLARRGVLYGRPFAPPTTRAGRPSRRPLRRKASGS